MTTHLYRLFLSGLFISGCFFGRAQQSVKTFVRETRYLLSLPEAYEKDTIQQWPLVLFLHGSGESGEDIQKVKLHGPPELADKGKKFPFILLSPQSDVPSGWDDKLLYQLLQHIKKSYRVDPDRVYLTGLSMGGFGTWTLAMKHPEEFAAIAPVCGGGDTATAWKLRHVPVWCFHGALDDVVSPSESVNMVKAAGRYNPSVRFTLYPDANHNSWDKTYSNDSLYHWLLSQKRFHYREAEVAEHTLKDYEGWYLGPDKDSVQLLLDKGILTAKPGKQVVALKAGGPDLFFIQPQLPMELRFLRSGSTVTGFVFMGDRRLAYRRLSAQDNLRKGNR